MKILITFLTACTIMSCGERIENTIKIRNLEDINKQQIKNIKNTNNVEIQHIISEVDDGLNKIKLNDSTTILIYRGMQSCTMIQLK
jgi:glucose-6-phosphate-specific signal transduction histidine kinase